VGISCWITSQALVAFQAEMSKLSLSMDEKQARLHFTWTLKLEELNESIIIIA
jgi:hypothetical protein